MSYSADQTPTVIQEMVPDLIEDEKETWKEENTKSV